MVNTGFLQLNLATSLICETLGYVCEHILFYRPCDKCKENIHSDASQGLGLVVVVTISWSK